MELKDAYDKIGKAGEKIKKRLAPRPVANPQEERRKRNQSYADKLNNRMKGNF